MFIFLHPIILLGLLGALAPWIILWVRRRPRRTVTFPSLFYFDHARSTVRPRPPWLDALLLSLLVALVVLALAHPVPKGLGPEVARLTVFVDHTPSLVARHPKWKETLGKALEGFIATHPGCRLDVADWNTVRDGSPPAPAEDAVSLMSKVGDSPLENGDPRWGDFEAWRGRFLPPERPSALLVVSGFSPRRGDRDGKLLYSLNLGPPVAPTAMSMAKVPSLGFAGETPRVSVVIHRSGAPANRKISIRDVGGKSLYVDSLAIPTGISAFEFPLPGLSGSPAEGAYHPLDLTLEGDAPIHAFGFVRVDGTLALSLLGESQIQAGRVARSLQHDTAHGHLRITGDGAVAAMAGLPAETVLKAWRGKPTVILLSSESRPDAMDDGLSRLLGLGLRVNPGPEAPATLTVPTAERLPPSLAEWSQLNGWNQVVRRGRYRVDLESRAEALWLWSDGSPFLVRDGKNFVVIGALGGREDILEHPLSVPLLTALVLAARDGSGPRILTPGSLPKGSRPVLESPEPTVYPEGVFRNGEDLFALVRPVEEMIFEPAPPRNIRPLSMEEWGQSPGPLHFPLHRLLAALAILVLLALVLFRPTTLSPVTRA